jgi:hypothetical protein
MNPPAAIKEIANLTKGAGVVDRTVKEIAELQHGYRFQRNPYAEANDSARSRNFINYEGPGGTKMADLKEKVQEGLKDEVEGHKYWVDTSKMLAAAGMKSEARQAAQKAGQETQHHQLLEKVKAKMNKKAELEKKAYIRHEGGKYVVYSHSGKHMGTYDSEAGAKHRLQQIEYFKKQGSAESQALLAKAKAMGAGNRDAFPFFAKGLLMERAERAASKLPIGGKGLGPELQKQPLVFNTLEKGGALDMAVYLRNRKTLLS